MFHRFFTYVRALSAGDSFLFKITLLTFVVSVIILGIALNARTQIEIASRGGSFTEGIIGTPRFVNPVLAVTRADKDLTTLVFDGLMKLGSDGTLAPHIAESITVSDDGLTYNIILRKDVFFHDGTPLTATDVLYTLGRIQDPTIMSQLRSNFETVLSEQVNEYEINLILREPYAPFIENLVFGILPQHIWKDVSSEEFPFSQYNSEPVGSGPYTVHTIHRNSSGIPDSYELTSYAKYFKGQPKIDTLNLMFYPNEEKLVQTFLKGELDSISGIDPSRITDLQSKTEDHAVLKIPLPRIFTLFINQNKSPVLRDKAVRKALDISIDRTALIQTVLGGYGLPTVSPIPTGFNNTTTTPIGTTTPIDASRAILKEAGWKPNTNTGIWEKNIDGTLTPLTFSIATINSPLFEATAEFLRTTWEQLGVTITVKQFEQSDLTQSIIRPRDYESLLFGTHVGRALDFYPFWHSSKRNDPGLNLSLYTNITTDSILSELRTNTNNTERNSALTRFAGELEKETPALFLYQPEFLYVFPKKITGAIFKGIGEPHERFANIENWYIDKESVWPIFKKTLHPQ